MPADPTRPDPMRPDPDQAREYLVAALRVARADAIEAGADPDAMTADLEERLRRVRRVLAADRDEPVPADE